MNAQATTSLSAMATLRSNKAAQSTSVAGVPGSRQPHSLRLAAPLSSSAAAAALALTSKQRFVRKDTLHSIAFLLRHVAVQIEAAALQDVMADPVASEYIMASVDRADELNSTTASASAPAAPCFPSDADRPAHRSMSSSESGADWVADAWVPSPRHDTVTQGMDSPLSRPTTVSNNLVRVPSMPTSSSIGSRSRHGRPSLPLSELHRQSRSAVSRTPIEQAIHAAIAAARSQTPPYSFPEKWFGHPAEAVALHSAQSLARDTVLNPSMRRALAATAKGFRPHWQAPEFSSKHALTTSTSFVTVSQSESPGTAVTLPPPPPPTRPVTATHRSPSYNRADQKKVLAVATAQPPLFFDNVLLDPETNRYLFRGCAFREEARVLQAPAVSASLTTASYVGDRESRDHANKPSRGSLSPSLLLVREYIPISAECSVVGEELQPLDASRDDTDAVVVQCFSLLPSQLAHIRPNQYQLLPESTIVRCLLVALPGCVTLATPLDAFLHNVRHSLLMVAGYSVDRLLGNPHGATKETRQPGGTRTSSPTATMTSSTSTAHESILYSSSSLEVTCGGGASIISASGAATKASLDTTGRDRDAARIAVVQEKLAQVVLPDILDEAMHAICSTLVVYCTQREQWRHMRVAVDAVLVLQRFFRGCLAVKERAVRRMMRLWRRLEVDARLKLQEHRPLPSAVEKIDSVANNILQEHMLTSTSYKRAFIEEQWAQRRRSFAAWRQDKEWDSVFASAGWRKQSSVDDNATDSAAEKRLRSARLSAAEQLRLESEFNKRRGWSSTVMLQCVVPPSSPTAAETYAEREQVAIRRLLSWYIDPRELLYLSHQRLLETLKGSVFRMEEVQLELKRATNRVMQEDSTTPLTDSVSCNSVHQRR
ncbi:hypothetical protein LPMP_330970 [Leishmania panamensis]|uniref:Uncharacterized protein n=1 Tax=Leishmania panamensis TaxID=5679 RepID=A0A088S1F4_LEIPA|nr:hypothetical protein LPMP_330970 [Leishmania panamensis]AIO01390.1 hypothetical protein LPMP_330970 [Leishmania panamensis]